MPAAISSPRFALLPPNSRRVRRAAARRAMAVAASTPQVEDRHDAGRAVDADRLAGRDLARSPGPVPTTAGSPYSRQTIAACDMTPPMSVTTALTFEKIGAQAGEVIGQTSTSPSRTSAISLDVDHDPRGALDDAGRRRGAGQLGRRRPPRCAHSWTRCGRDAPEHDASSGR